MGNAGAGGHAEAGPDAAHFVRAGHGRGYDASDTLTKGLGDGHIDGLVLQDPVKMGYLAVKTLVAQIRGETVEKRIDTGVRLVTRAEMNQPDVRELLAPDLSRWLK